MTYFIYLLIMVFLCYLGNFREQKSSIIFRILACILFVLLVGLRSPLVGVDSHTYYNHFYVYGNFGCHFVEQGFDLLTRVLYHLGFDYTSLFLMCVLIPAIPIFFTLENCEKYFASALMFYLLSFTTCVNGIRQVVVCGIFLFAVKYITSQNFLKYCILIILGWTFHASALILLPLYFILRYSASNKVYIGIYLFSFIFLVIPASSIIESIMPYLNFGSRNYAELHSEVSTSSASLLGFLYASVLRGLIFFLMLKTNSFKKNTVLSNLVFLSVVVPNIGFTVPLMSRISMYFTWFGYLLLPTLVSEYTVGLKNKFFQISLLFVLLYFIGFCNSYFSKANRVYPYTFYWEYSNNKHSIYKQ